MALYEVRCPACGVQDVRRPMEESGNWLCPLCRSPAQRIFAPPYDHSDNTFHEYRSENLCREPGAVRVTSRADEKEKMARMGVSRYEKGEIKDFNKARAERERSAGDGSVAAVKSETVKRLYFAKNYGYAPEER